MSTEKWITLCVVFAVASFFAGVVFNNAANQTTIDGCIDREREY